MRHWATAGAFLVAATASYASAPAPEGRPDVTPDWLKKPTPEQLLTVYPTAAMKRGISGSAVIGCEVTIEGMLRACEVVTESPRGMGFGAAAIALTPQFVMKPAMKNGRPVPSKIRMPLNFNAMGSGLRPESRTVVSNVTWIDAPSVADLRGAYPPEARAKGLGGHTSLYCQFGAEGSLRNCSVVTEEPKHVGFGKAALQLSKKFVGPSKLADGRSTRELMVQVPITFSTATLVDRPRVGSPKWEILPTRESLLQVAPAVHQDVSVRVLMDCTVAGSGKLEQCVVESESPAGGSFGDGVLRLSSLMKVSVWTDEGLPTIGGRLRVPIRYEVKAIGSAAAAP